MDKYLLSVDLLHTYATTVIFFTVIFSIFNNDSSFSAKEMTFSGLKCVGYLFLALIIYKHYIKLDQMPVLDFFTFVLAAFEGGHNFVNSIGLIFVSLFKLIFFRR